MEQIMLIAGNTYLYWSSVIRALAAGGAVCCFWGLYLHKGGPVGAAAVCVPAAALLSLALSRLCHWYFRPEIYESFEKAMDLRQPGGFALMGVFAGCFLAALLVRLLGLTKNLPELLDCISVAGCLGIAVGRLGFWFNTADRGSVLDSGRWFPWVSSIVNPVSGAEEFRLSVFLLQAAAAGVLFLALLSWYLIRLRHHRDGDGTLIFLLCHGAAQALLDSMRYDALRFPGNGFISAVQVLGAAGMLLAAAVFGAVLVSTTGLKKWYFLLWLLQAGCFAAAGFMEYWVQRHGDMALRAYSIMAAALALLVGLTLLTRGLAEKEKWGITDGKASEKTDQIPE